MMGVFDAVDFIEANLLVSEYSYFKKFGVYELALLNYSDFLICCEISSLDRIHRKRSIEVNHKDFPP